MKGVKFKVLRLGASSAWEIYGFGVARLKVRGFWGSEHAAKGSKTSSSQMRCLHFSKPSRFVRWGPGLTVNLASSRLSPGAGKLEIC